MFGLFGDVSQPRILTSDLVYTLVKLSLGPWLYLIILVLQFKPDVRGGFPCLLELYLFLIGQKVQCFQNVSLLVLKELNRESVLLDMQAPHVRRPLAILPLSTVSARML